jgi:hypothetical protein
VKLLAVIAVAAAAIGLTATSSTAGAAQGIQHHPMGFVPHIAPKSRFATTPAATQAITAARQTSKASGLNCIVACSAYESTINRFFTDVAADNGLTTNVYSVATQYSAIQYNETVGAAYVDGSPYPTKGTCKNGYDRYCVTDTQLQLEIAKVVAKNHWPIDGNTAYFIFTPASVGVCIYGGYADEANPCTTNAFCAYHSSSANGIIYAVEPDAEAVIDGECDPAERPAGNAADATINTISHEHNEAITDPAPPTGWIASNLESENGDLCAYDFGTPQGSAGTEYNQVINGHNYFLQLEYSNAANSGAGGCVPYLGGTPSVADPADGYGPLVYQGGAVMTTNTVHAIYWVPARPANSKVPTISGKAEVGKKLQAAHGTWSNSPKYTYRWLRCSAAGKSCKNIAKATAASYKLMPADKGHRIEVRVTGTNMVGHVSATSAATAKVKK